MKNNKNLQKNFIILIWLKLVQVSFKKMSFSMFLLSAGMLVGLRTRSTKLLLSWVLLSILLICPEAGMVLFMAIFHWDGATEGIIELGMWILRVLFNVAGMICTQSLYVHWRNEKAVIR